MDTQPNPGRKKVFQMFSGFRSGSFTAAVAVLSSLFLATRAAKKQKKNTFVGLCKSG